MNKGFEEIYEGMRVNRENFCLECVFISEIKLVYFRISLVHFGTVINQLILNLLKYEFNTVAFSSLFT